jgi:trehalose 6-phosphate phosphatase
MTRMAASLLSAAGLDSLAFLARRHALFAFDFDGTLAPIRDRPEDVRIAPSLAGKLSRLAAKVPVAIVTGRRIDDVRQRLGFVPHAIVGSHGAEDHADPRATSKWADALSPLRVHLLASRRELMQAGVKVEDKAQSIALHYRTAPDPDVARAAIDKALSRMPPAVRRFDGKDVVNIVVAQAPDKAVAVRTLLEELGCDALFFAGDDLNDEPVFEAAQADWVTVKIGPDASSRARFCLHDQAQVESAVDGLLAVLERPAGADAQRSAKGV